MPAPQNRVDAPTANADLARPAPIMSAMRVIAGKVKNGVVVPKDDDGLVEGATVSVVANDSEATFTAPPEDEAALLTALAEDAGTISSEDLLSRLK
jgi:hemin uptake protein HemP